jgi:hypothetical protein
MDDPYSEIKMAQDNQRTLEYIGLLHIVAIFLPTCTILLYHTLQHMAPLISDRATRLKEQFKAACEEEDIGDEPWWVAFAFVSILSVVLGASGAVSVWFLVRFFCVLFVGGVSFWCLRDWMTRPATRPGTASRAPKIEIPTEADVGDRKEVEGKDEVVTDEDYMDDTDDTWSSNLDTPSASESESSHSNDTSTSANNVRTGRAAIRGTSVRGATRAGFTPKTAASCLDAFFPPPPLGIIILQVKKGAEFRESMVVLMYKTTPFVQLKDKLRKKDEDDSELVVKGSGGDYPVFDNETPLSVSSIHRVLIVVVEKVQTLMFSM